jgi:hypothetical protein
MECIIFDYNLVVFQFFVMNFGMISLVELMFRVQLFIIVLLMLDQRFLCLIIQLF